MAAMQSVEDADRHVSGPCPPEARPLPTRPRAAPRRRGTGAAAHRARSGASTRRRLARERSGPGRRTSSPARSVPRATTPSRRGPALGVEQPDPCPRLGSGSLAGLTCWPRAAATTSSSERGATGIDSRPTSIGSSSRAKPAGPPAAAARTASRSCAASRRNGPLRGSRERAEVGAAAKPLPEVAGQRPDVRAGAALHVQHRSGAVGVRAVPLDQLQAVDRHRPRGELEQLTLSGQPVGPAAPDLQRAERRRALLDRSPEAAQAPPRRPRASAPARRRGSARRRGRRSSSWRRSRPWPGRPCRRPGGTRRRASPVPGRRAARPRRTDRACRRGPTRRVPRQAADEADDVVRGGTGRSWPRRGSPSTPRALAVAGVAHACGRPLACYELDGAGQDRAGAPPTSGSDTVAPAARACPPPPNVPVRTVASTPPSRVRTLSASSPSSPP